MGGKDVIYFKQQHTSSLQAVDVQKRLKEMSDSGFLDANGLSDISFRDAYGKDKVFPSPLHFLPPRLAYFLFDISTIRFVQSTSVVWQCPRGLGF